MKRKVGLGVALTVLAATVWLVAAPVQVGGRTAYLITHGDSMEPGFRAGDLAIIREARSYGVGDVAAYTSRELQAVVMHRIVAVEDGRYTMRGDNNDFLDPERPEADDLLGTPVLRVPQGGIWLRRLTRPAVIAGAAFFVLVGGGAARTATRRRRRRAQPGTLPAAPIAPMTSAPMVRVAAVVVVVAGVISAALGFVATRPTATTAPQTAVPSMAASMTYSYKATVRPSAAYDTTTVTDPQPVFRRLADTVDIAYAYKTSAAVSAGEIHTTVTLSTTNGWSSTLALGQDASFSGVAHDGTVELDLADLQSRADEAATAIGAGPAGPVTVRVATQVAADDRITFRPELDLLLDDAALRLADGSPSPLSFRQSILAGAPDVESSGVSVLGRALPQRASRSATLFGLTVMLIAAIVLATAAGRARRSPEDVTIQQRHGSLLLAVEPMVLPSGRPVVDVPRIDGLVRLAARYGLMVLHWNRGGAHTYVVFEDNTTYRFRLHASQPPPPDHEPADEEIAPGAEVHVTPYGARWAVRRASEGAPVSVHLDLDEAIDCARAIALRNRTTLIVFDSCWTRPEVSLLTDLGGTPDGAR